MTRTERDGEFLSVSRAPSFLPLRDFEAVLVGLGDLTLQRARCVGAGLQEASRLDPGTREAGIQHERFVSPLQSRL